MKRLLILATVLTSACATATEPLNDPRVSNQWAMDVCAERDRSEQRACMRQGRTEAPAPHFDATERCGPRGLEEYDVSHDPAGRLHIEIWCLPADDAATVSRAYPAGTCVGDGVECLNRLASRQCPNGANDYDAHRDASGQLHVDAGCD